MLLIFIIILLLFVFVGTFVVLHLYLKNKTIAKTQEDDLRDKLNTQNERNTLLLKKHSSALDSIQNTLQKQKCSTSKDRTNCFNISRKSGVNEVNTKYLQIEIKPIYKDIITKEKFKVIYKCRFVPTDLDERGIILFDGALARPELITLNREKGTLDITFHTTLKLLKFKMYPYIHTLSIMKILVEEMK